MDTNTSYEAERAVYYKVLVGLLVLTVVTLIQPDMFFTEYTFATQIFIGAIKAWLIVMYYMHLRGEKLIGASVLFAVTLVVFFFIMVGIDVANFQFEDVSHITSPKQ